MLPPKTNNGRAKTAMIIGIIALVLSVVPLVGIVSWALGPLAIVFGFIGLRQNLQRGQSITGIVTGIIALIICMIWLTAFIATVPNIQTSPPGSSTKTPTQTSSPPTSSVPPTSKTNSPNDTPDCDRKHGKVKKYDYDAEKYVCLPDRDRDGTADKKDEKPDLNNNKDADGDGYSNGIDDFPHDADRTSTYTPEPNSGDSDSGGGLHACGPGDVDGDGDGRCNES